MQRFSRLLSVKGKPDLRPGSAFQLRLSRWTGGAAEAYEGPMDWPSKAAVFGASGGIGAALVRALVARGAEVLAGSRAGEGPELPGVTPFAFDLTDGEGIAVTVSSWNDSPPDLVIVATGVLTLADGTGPERSLKALEADAMAEAFRLNTIGPAMIARNVLPLFPRERRSVFAALSAWVGSIGEGGRPPIVAVGPARGQPGRRPGLRTGRR